MMDDFRGQLGFLSGSLAQHAEADEFTVSRLIQIIDELELVAYAARQAILRIEQGDG